MTIQELIEKWKDVKKTSLESATRLREDNQFELSLECWREVKVIDLFLKDLEEVTE